MYCFSILRIIGGGFFSFILARHTFYLNRIGKEMEKERYYRSPPTFHFALESDFFYLGHRNYQTQTKKLLGPIYTAIYCGIDISEWTVDGKRDSEDDRIGFVLDLHDLFC